mmetsp:Transcript_9490/g.25745  ORF Transcript_9490/g.25745 Transcript_9490/m.25745 type:complete len:751 (-) Transcript_9490:232-2484(-)
MPAHLAPFGLSAIDKQLRSGLLTFEEHLSRSRALKEEMVDVLGSLESRLSDLQDNIKPVHEATQKLQLGYENVDTTLKDVSGVVEHLSVPLRVKDAIEQGPRGQFDTFFAALDKINTAIKALPSALASQKAIEAMQGLKEEAISQCLEEFGRLVTKHGSVSTTQIEALQTVKDLSVDFVMVEWVRSQLRQIVEVMDKSASTAYFGIFKKARVDFVRKMVVEKMCPFRLNEDSHPKIEAAFRNYRPHSHPILKFFQSVLTLLKLEVLVAVDVFKTVDETASNQKDMHMFMIFEETALIPFELMSRLSSYICDAKLGKTSDRLVMFLDVIRMLSLATSEFEEFLQEHNLTCPGGLKEVVGIYRAASIRTVAELQDETQNHSGALPKDGTVHELTSTVLSTMKRLLEFEAVIGSMTTSMGEGGRHRSIAQDDGLTSSLPTPFSSGSASLQSVFVQLLNALYHNLGTKARELKHKQKMDRRLKSVFLLNNINHVCRSLATAQLGDIVGDIEKKRWEFYLSGEVREFLRHCFDKSRMFIAGDKKPAKAIGSGIGTPILKKLASSAVLTNSNDGSPASLKHAVSFVHLPNRSSLVSADGAHSPAGSTSSSMLQRGFTMASIAGSSTGGGSEGELKGNDKKDLKSRFAGFNDEVEELQHAVRKYVIPEESLRDRLRKEMVDYIVPLYSEFYSENSSLNFTKNRDKYVRFTPDRLERVCRSFFGGEGGVPLLSLPQRGGRRMTDDSISRTSMASEESM